MPQTRSGLLSNSGGPGCRPYCWNAASMIAAVAEVGRPSESSGASVPAADALLAASGPATLRSRHGRILPGAWSAAFRQVGQEVGISLPPAGRAPIGKPRTVPRSQGFHERFQSSRLIHFEPLSA